MVVGLRKRGAVTGKPLLALPVSVQDLFISLGSAFFHPGKQGWAEIETDTRVIVNDLGDATLLVENAGGAVRQIALGGDALVPVVIRGS